MKAKPLVVWVQFRQRTNSSDRGDFTLKRVCATASLASAAAAETSEVFRQVPAMTILLKPATVFHPSSTGLFPGRVGRRAASTR